MLNDISSEKNTGLAPSKELYYAKFLSASSSESFALNLISRHMRATFNFPQTGAVIFIAVAETIAFQLVNFEFGARDVAQFKTRLFSPSANSEDLNYQEIKTFVEAHYKRIGLEDLDIPIQKYADMYCYHFYYGVLKLLEGIAEHNSELYNLCWGHMQHNRGSLPDMSQHLETVFDDLFCMPREALQKTQDILAKNLDKIYADNEAHQLARSLLPKLKEASGDDRKIILANYRMRLTGRIALITSNEEL